MIHRFGPEVEKTINLARKERAKVSVFDDKGCLLWFCEKWEHEVGSVEKWSQALGYGWIEFLHDEDIPAVKKWIEGSNGAQVVFRSVGPDGKGWQKVCLVKQRVGLYWVAIGDRMQSTPNFPAMGCAVLSVAGMVAHNFGQAAAACMTIKGG